ncbi:MAG: nucleotide sugar dehydrogenase, partial [Deltaproteobacteria bacterium]|nr:nucleotide sugar dehydrogenase [Deltaproteobacteria bacterium]
WKAREFDMPTRFIELAGEINTNMPYYVLQKTVDALNSHGKSVKGANVLILGVAYKKDIDDMRETPALKLIELLQDKEAQVDYYDPYIPVLPFTRKYQYEMNSIDLNASTVKNYDCVIVVTDHTNVDYELVKNNAALIIDTRNVYNLNGRMGDGNIVKA